MPTRNNHFEKYKLFYIPLIFIVIWICTDFIAAKLFNYYAGVSWSEYCSNLATNKVEELKIEELSKNEKLYRIKHGIYHHDLKSNVMIKQTTWGPLIYSIKTNSLGFKDESTRAVSLTPENYRLLFIGDSFTEGLGIEYASTFVGLIDKHYKNKNVEVLNAAVSSYSPIIYWRKLKYLIEETKLKCDEVVVYIDISDIQDDGVMYTLDENQTVIDYKLVRARKKIDNPGLSAESLGPRSTPVIIDILERNTIITHKIFVLIDEFINPKIRDTRGLNLKRAGWTFDDKIYDEYGQGGLIKSTEYMDRLVKLLNKHNIKLTIAVYPWPDQILYDDLNSLQVRHWRSWALKRGVGFIDNFPLFIKKSSVKISKKIRVINKYFIPGDMHWTKEGHKLLADHFIRNYRIAKSELATH